MTIAINEFRVDASVAPRPSNPTNSYAFPPSLAEAANDLPVDPTVSVFVPVPEGLPKKHGFTRAVSIFVNRNATGEFLVVPTASGTEVMITKTAAADPAA